jgi:high-affinity Fe2+/Pb2+ permease
VEGAIFIAGVWIYLNTTKSRNNIGIIGFWVLILLLVVIYLQNLFGPPPSPSDIKTMGWTSQLQWIFILLAFWVDKNRQLV